MPLDWTAWAPPLDPPTEGGLPADTAQAIADAYWLTDPHLAAAMMWEAYAATLPPAAAVAQVSTGVQSVSYAPPMPGGDSGLAMGRAAWHRSLRGNAEAVELDLAPPAILSVPPGFLPMVWLIEESPGSGNGNGNGGTPEPIPAVASFTVTPAPAQTADCTFDGTGSTGSEGSAILAWSWLFKGSVVKSGPVVSWRFPNGSQQVTMALTVTDELGQTATSEQVASI